MNILIVDDEKDLLSELKDFFIDRGYSVSTANNGKEAWNICCNTDKVFDVILTDHRMPIMNGIEFVQKIRNNFMTMPVVMMSGDGEASRDSYIGREIIELLPKPTRISKLDEIFTNLERNGFKAKDMNAIKTVLIEAVPILPQKMQDLPLSKNVTTEKLVSPLSEHIVRILVADDEPELLDLICEMLETEDYQTVKANDGLEALEKWQNMLINGEKVDIIMCDLRMPRMDGLALLEAIRNIDPFIPVIVLTGHADFDDAYALLKAYDIADFLAKPLDSTGRLIFSVNRALQYAKMAREVHNK